MNLSTQFRNLLIACLLAVGVLLIWLVGVTFVVESRSVMGKPYLHENINIDESGVPYIWRRSNVQSSAGIRTLDGNVLTRRDGKYKPDAWPDTVLSIETHVVRANKIRQRRPTFSPQLICWRGWNSAWYLTRPRVTNEPVYFEGFEWSTGKRIGYIGRNGFSTGVPVLADRFPFEDSERFIQNRLSSDCPTGYDETPPGIGKVAAETERGNSIYLISAGKLFQLGLRQRDVKEIPVNGVPVVVNARYLHREDFGLTVRTDESFILFDSERNVTASFEIPEPIRNSEFLTLHRVSNSEAVIEASDRSRGSRDVQLWKVTPDETNMFAEVKLKEQVAETYSALFRVFAAPSLLPLCFSFVELDTVDESYDPEHKSRVRMEIGASIYVVAILSTLLGVFVFRMERRAGRSGLAWAIFVFLMGIPGLFGYWFHQKWPSRITCDKCYAAQAHRRQSCMSCEADMITGAPLASDMFA